VRRLARRTATLALAAAGVAAAHGCTERLEGGRGCPVLCPDQTVELHETLVAGVVLDTTVAAYPALGEEPLLTLAWRGDTLETRVIVRYDTLPSTYPPPGGTTSLPIDYVEGAELRIRLRFPTTPENQTVTVEAYDVDTTMAEGGAADTAAATMLPLFRADRLIGTRAFSFQDIRTTTDSLVRIPLDNAYLLAKIQARARLRVGLLVRAAESAELVFQGVEALRPPVIGFRATPGESGVQVTAVPYSATPAERFVASFLSDFVIVAQRRPPDTPTEVIIVGGIPGRRSYLRFDLPSNIVDSTSVVRATLFLTQYPNRLAAHAPDSVSVYPQPVMASDLITDIQAQADLLTPIFVPTLRQVFRLDSLRTAPQDSGEIAIEVIGAVQVWRATQKERTIRALVLRMPNEGVGLDELYFFSTEAAASLRPRLRLVYVPQVDFGLP
jgi:hypothetical protein